MSGYAWMPHRKGMVSGFVMAGFGMGAAIFNLVAMAWVNPDNIGPNPETGYYDEVYIEHCSNWRVPPPLFL